MVLEMWLDFQKCVLILCSFRYICKQLNVIVQLWPITSVVVRHSFIFRSDFLSSLGGILINFEFLSTKFKAHISFFANNLKFNIPLASRQNQYMRTRAVRQVLSLNISCFWKGNHGAKSKIRYSPSMETVKNWLNDFKAVRQRIT